MRHAMLMCVHKNFNILQLFLDLFEDERFDFYILLDKKSPIDESCILKRYPQKSKLYFCPRMNISWAGHSQIKAVLELFKISTKNSYDYYHFFTNNKYYRHNVLCKAADKILLILQKLLRIHRNQDIPLYAGSALTSLSHACVMYVLSKEAEIKHRFYYSLASDEFFLQTIIENSPFKDHIYKFDQSSLANARLIDWENRDDNSPYTFTSSDYKKLIHADKDLCFARKFDENIDFEIVQKLFDFLSKQPE